MTSQAQEYKLFLTEQETQAIEIAAETLIEIPSKNNNRPKLSQAFHLKDFSSSCHLLPFIRSVYMFQCLELKEIVLSVILIERLYNRAYIDKDSIHGAVTISCLLAIKYSSDKVAYKSFSNMLNVSRNQIVSAEKEFLSLIEYEVHIDEETYKLYEQELVL